MRQPERWRENDLNENPRTLYTLPRRRQHVIYSSAGWSIGSRESDEPRFSETHLKYESILFRTRSLVGRLNHVRETSLAFLERVQDMSPFCFDHVTQHTLGPICLTWCMCARCSRL